MRLLNKPLQEASSSENIGEFCFRAWGDTRENLEQDAMQINRILL
jgi:hypothetical protein